MKPYKFINCNRVNEISKKLYEYVVNETDILEKKWEWNTLNLPKVLLYVPELQEECSKIIPVPITMIAIVYRSPGKEWGVHIDTGNYNYRLLWPVKNCEGSYTRFFDANGNIAMPRLGLEGDIYTELRSDYPLIEIDAVELTSPIIFNTRIPHGVFTNPKCTEPRLSVTIGFNNFPLETLMNSN